MAQTATPTESITEELLLRNKEFAKTHQPIKFMSEGGLNGSGPKAFIFCCFDPRVDPSKFLGLSPEEAILVRNAGGNVRGGIEQLIYLDFLLNSFSEVLVIGHTDCGTTMAKSSDIKQKLRKENEAHEEEIQALQLPDTEDVEQRIRHDVELLKNHPLLRAELKAKTKGYIYDLKTGKVNEVAR